MDAVRGHFVYTILDWILEQSPKGLSSSMWEKLCNFLFLVYQIVNLLKKNYIFLEAVNVNITQLI